ncbi:hypothetical protein BH10ACT2_BH10ACT2_21030 [soil metagenome]
MAAALLAMHTRRAGVDAVIASAGTHSHDLPVDAEAVSVMAELGLDIASHVPRRLDQSIVDSEGADLIITMTRDHLRVVATVAPGALRRAFTLRELVRRLAMSVGMPSLATLNEGRTARDLLGEDFADDVDDPYGKGLQQHRECLVELDSAMRAIAADLRLLQSDVPHES